MIHPAIYTQPSEIKQGDPRGDSILVGSFETGWESLKAHRLRVLLDRICEDLFNGGKTHDQTTT